MFGIGTGEMLLIFVIAVLVVGPERTAQFARDAGRVLAQFRRQTESVTKEFREALAIEELEKEAKSIIEAPIESNSSSEVSGLEAVNRSTSPTVASPDDGPLIDDTSAVTLPSDVPSSASHIQGPFIDSETRVGSSHAADGDDGSADHAEWALPTVIRVGEMSPKSDQEAKPTVIEPVLVVKDESLAEDAQQGEDS